MSDLPFQIGDFVQFKKKMGPGLPGSFGEVRFVSEQGVSVRILYNHLRRPFQFTVSAQPFENFELLPAEERKKLEEENAED